MGWNTTVVVMNDALGAIERDPDFGRKLAAAIQRAMDGQSHDVSALGHVNAATVVETHHADGTRIVAVGQNYGRVIGGLDYNHTADDITVLKNVAERLGYRLTKIPTKSLASKIRAKGK